MIAECRRHRHRALPIRSGHPKPIRQRELQMVGWRSLQMRKSLGDEAAMTRMEAWADAPVPKFHKL